MEYNGVFKISELSKLAGKGKKVKIGEIEIEIKPLSISNMDLMMKLGKEGEDQASAMRELITQVLKESVPDSTDEEIANVSVEHIQTIMEAITEVNNLEKPKGENDIIAKIKERQK